MDVNTCFETTKDYHVIAYYSHLLPLFITLVIISFILFRLRSSFLYKSTVLFFACFCLWLIGDAIIWISVDYNLVSFIWATLDYINILFYLFGFYFFLSLIKGKDLSLWQIIVFFLISVPAWWTTATNQSITVFNQSTCEALNSDFLTQYKFIVEVVVIALIMLYTFLEYRKSKREKVIKVAVVAFSLVLFFAIFSVTEYISSTSGVYEINLFSLFILPVFLFMIVYAISSLEIFKIRFLGSQLLSYLLIVMIGSQVFFLEDATEKKLSMFTLLISFGFVTIFIRNGKRELAQREEIERQRKELQIANEKLKGLDKLKSEFISLASHQLRSPLTVIKGYASTLTDGIVGDLTDKQKEVVQHIYISAQGLASVVEDFLNVTKIEQGGMKYVFAPTDIRQIVNDLASDMRIPAVAKKLDFQTDIHTDGAFMVNADGTKMKQVFLNLIDNSIKYTKDGFVKVWLNKADGQMTFGVSDSGVGVSVETRAKLFQKFGRGEGAVMNGGGSGLGLYLAQEIVKAHGGEIKVDSEGLGKGSTFSVTLPLLK